MKKSKNFRSFKTPSGLSCLVEKRGFTLVELLVAISIVGLLSSVVLATLNTAKIKARDADRIAGLKQIQAAIELYAADHDGQYPGHLPGELPFMRSAASAAEVGVPPSPCGYGAPGTPGEGTAYAPGIWCKLQTALLPYISKVPATTGSMPPFYGYVYKVPSLSPLYNPNGVKAYGLSVVLEQANSASINDGGFSDTIFEVGELPAYCKAKNSNWISWSSVPCDCTVYYTSGCVY